MNRCMFWFFLVCFSFFCFFFLLLHENFLKFAEEGKRKCLFISADCCPLMLSSKSKTLLCDSFNRSKCAEQKRKISKHQLSHKLEVGLKWEEKLGAMV